MSAWIGGSACFMARYARPAISIAPHEDDVMCIERRGSRSICVAQGTHAALNEGAMPRYLARFGPAYLIERPTAICWRTRSSIRVRAEGAPFKNLSAST